VNDDERHLKTVVPPTRIERATRGLGKRCGSPSQEDPAMFGQDGVPGISLARGNADLRSYDLSRP